MYELERKQVLNTALKLDQYGLIALMGGNVSWRVSEKYVLITPSGMVYDQMVATDVLVIDMEGNVVEGERKPSVDTKALLYIMKHKPSAKAVIHTHQPYATGLGLVMDKIPCNLSTLANSAEGSVNVAPYGDPGSLSMGIQAVGAIGDRLSVVLKHHGVIGIGKDLQQALVSVVYLEEAAKTISVALSTGKPMAEMTPKQIQTAVDVFRYHYGQSNGYMNKKD
ncbi:class II aldolase/adducin family protein [Alkalibaculum bacchi]|jgi:L-ribulose-5-phosphate 4-epimerase|uniref:class II aldolase/adducin family protein n=1 Tax=Alkalibaculum bacchi TaxID=645887 RepID=UPI0026E9D607|nr:class II aldolase/adducin family protein [Alkalibaculum bacchi]MCI1934026.1 class II aldolase/adducin family protein [Atopobiaceae bacterium]